MSGNVELVRRFFDLWTQGVRDVPIDQVAPDIEIVSPLTQVRGWPYRGYEDARRWIEDVTEQFETWEYTIEEVKDVGESVLAFGHVHLVGRGSGISLEQEGAWLIDFADDGRIQRLRVFTDRAEALAAAGLGE